MDKSLDPGSLHDAWEKFSAVLSSFPVRPSHLVPDLALLGFGKDLLDHAYATVLLCRSERPRSSFASARAAKEAADEMVLLATEVDFDRAGARAYGAGVWEAVERARLFDGLESQQSASQVDDVYGPYREHMEDMADAWDKVASGKGKVIREILSDASPSSGRHLGSWHKYNVPSELAERVKRFDAMAKTSGNSAHFGDLSRLIYGMASMHAHPRARVNPKKIWLDDLARVRVEEFDSYEELAGIPETVAGTALILGEVSLSYVFKTT